MGTIYGGMHSIVEASVLFLSSFCEAIIPTVYCLSDSFLKNSDFDKAVKIENGG